MLMSAPLLSLLENTTQTSTENHLNQGKKYNGNKTRLDLKTHDTIVCVVHMWTDISEECITSIFRVENQLSKRPVCRRWQCTYRLHGIISHKMATLITKQFPLAATLSEVVWRFLQSLWEMLGQCPN
jgi:hypothetical protein